MTHPDTKPEALQVADDLELTNYAGAQAIRRLHAECESMRTQLAEARAEAEALTTALAACRDVFPLIEPNDPAELPWLDAVAFPGAVPAYVKAKADALRADARRWRAMRECRKSVQLYVYEDPADPFSGDWQSKNSPADFDAFADAAMKEGER